MNFGQALNLVEKQALKKVTWVCGPEVFLREEIITLLTQTLAAEEVLRLSAATLPEREIWELANQYPFDPGHKRLLIIREAERIQNWAPLENWMANSRRLPQTTLIFVADEARLRHQISPDGKESFAEPLSFIANRGSMVEARRPNDEDFIAWVRLRTGSTASAAQHLIQHCGGNLGRVSNLIRLLVSLRAKPSPSLTEQLVEATAPADFVQNLITLNKATALGSLPEGPELREAIRQLDYLLTCFSYIHPMLKRQYPIREIAAAGRVPSHLAKRLLDYGKHYDPKRIERRRQLLAEIDHFAAKPGALDLGSALVSLW